MRWAASLLDTVLFSVDDLDNVCDLIASEMNKLWLLTLILILDVLQTEAHEKENEKPNCYFLFVFGEGNGFYFRVFRLFFSYFF